MSRYHIGLSAGASMFGIDAALVRIDGQGLALNAHLEQSHHLSYSKDLRDLLRRVHATTTPELRHVGTLHRVLGETCALTVRQLLDKTRVLASQLYCIGCIGHQLWHDADGRYPAVMNIGMASVVAERTGLTTLTDFTDRDLAAGGQGAPLTALADALLFHRSGERRALLHLGSVATLVSLPGDLPTNLRNVVAFEVAPCTLLFDAVMSQLSADRELFDAGGKHAVQGRCLEPLLQRWLDDSFLQRRPPKCVARRDFGSEFIHRAIDQAKRIQGELRDVLCTQVHFVARAIAHAVENYLSVKPERILLAGRGARNGFLWRLLEQCMPHITFEKTDSCGIAVESRKATAAAVLAALTLDGVPISLPSATGASGPRTLGQWTPGDSANWARCLTWMARQTSPLRIAAA